MLTEKPKKLTGFDYIHLPFKDLSQREDFSDITLNKVVKFLDLTSEEIEKIELPKTKEEIDAQ